MEDFMAVRIEMKYVCVVCKKPIQPRELATGKAGAFRGGFAHNACAKGAKPRPGERPPEGGK